MKDILVQPAMLAGELSVPSSKSLSHRALIAAALANGGSQVDGLLDCDDTQATLGGLKALGYAAQGAIGSGSVVFPEKQDVPSQAVEIDCIESGSTLRFLIPLALVSSENVVFKGRGRLLQRPLEPYFDIFREQAIDWTLRENRLSISGRLKSGRFRVPGNISSQFITGLLFALPLLEGDSEIIIEGKFESVDYVRITLDVLKTYSVDAFFSNDKIMVRGGQRYMPCSFVVEGDWSSAAFWSVAGALGSGILMRHMNDASLQGDKAVLAIAAQTGALITKDETGISVRKGDLRAFDVDCADIPDIVPVLSVLASYCEGTSVMRNIIRLRLKESDRLQAVIDNLAAFGVHAQESAGNLLVHGRTDRDFSEAVNIDSFADHRIAMAFSIMAAFSQSKAVIHGAECIAKSYPDFYQDFNHLGGDAIELSLGQ